MVRQRKPTHQGTGGDAGPEFPDLSDVPVTVHAGGAPHLATQNDSAPPQQSDDDSTFIAAGAAVISCLIFGCFMGWFFAFLQAESSVDFAYEANSCRSPTQFDNFRVWDNHLKIPDPRRDKYHKYPYPHVTNQDPSAFELDLKSFNTFDQILALQAPSHTPDWGTTRPYRMLVAGGGSGEATASLAYTFQQAKVSYEIVHLDWSEPALKMTQARLNNLNLRTNVKIQMGDITRIDEIAGLGTFDHIDCTHVLQHLHYPTETLTKLSAMLNPGGGIVVSVPADTRPQRGRMEFREALMRASLDENNQLKPMSERIEIANALLDSLPNNHRLFAGTDPNKYSVADDVEMFNLFFHNYDRLYSLEQLQGMGECAGLRVQATGQAQQYELAAVNLGPALDGADVKLETHGSFHESLETKRVYQHVASNREHTIYYVKANNPRRLIGLDSLLPCTVVQLGYAVHFAFVQYVWDLPFADYVANIDSSPPINVYGSDGPNFTIQKSAKLTFSPFNGHRTVREAFDLIRSDPRSIAIYAHYHWPVQADSDFEAFVQRLSKYVATTYSSSEMAMHLRNHKCKQP
eukprot:GFYU01037937.1.p1 GENE.GFYU01037937.1~~GFYU01037937.1.p1  ORF type:complete len:575 (+),score=93.55 GFYU01037937.1:108-1832(+)